MTSAPARLTKPTSSASINSTTHATRIRRLVVAMMRYLVRDDHPSDGRVISTKSSKTESAAYKSHAENKLMHTRPTLKATMSVHETELSLTCKKSPVTKRAIVQRYKRPPSCANAAQFKEHQDSADIVVPVPNIVMPVPNIRAIVLSVLSQDKVLSAGSLDRSCH